MKRRRSGAADRRLLPLDALAGPMPWIVAVMLFLTVLAAAAGLGLGSAARTLGDDLAGQLTVQVVEADPSRREQRAQAIASRLAALPGVATVNRVPEAELAAQLSPWLGVEALAADELPIPALIEVRLSGPITPPLETRLRAAAAGATIERDARWLAPVADLIAALRWLAAGVVAMMAAATAACVVLAARAALNSHLGTIDVLHLMGATDQQIAALFQRRIAVDALLGGLVGLAGGLAVIVLLGRSLAALGTGLASEPRLSPLDWGLIAALPFAAAALATLATRITVLRAVRKVL